MFTGFNVFRLHIPRFTHYVTLCVKRRMCRRKTI